MLLLNDTMLQMSVLRRIHFPFVKNEKLSNFLKLIDSLQLSQSVCECVCVLVLVLLHTEY